MTTTYWHNVLTRRLSRRRALAATSATAAAAALLAACGGSTDTGSSTTDKSSLVSAAADTSKTAKRGGLNKWFLTSEASEFDVHTGGNPKNNPKNMVYANLVSAKPGYLKAQDFSDYIPDAAQSWEWSPDGLTLTMKIQPNAKWHNKPPINGRPFDIEDMMFTWQRFQAKGRDRGALVNSVNPDAPLLSITSTDSRTIVLKLKEPTVYLLALFAPTTVGKMIIVPKETDSTFKIERDMIGIGPYVETSYTPSVGMTFKKHPDYFEKDFAFLDTIDAPFVLEYANGLAQFKAGNVYTWAVRQEDVITMKKDAPDIKVYATEPSGFSGAAVNFGWLPAASSPFRDERVRQAMSMSWDRDLFLDVMNNVENFRQQGLPVDTYWSSSLSAGTGTWRLDPRGKEFGANSKYYQHDVAAAKQLLSAAGYPNGLDVTSSYIPGPELGDAYIRENQILEDMARQVGFRPKTNLVDYVKEYPNYRDNQGKYEGYSYIAGPTTADEATGFLVWRYTKGGGAGYLGFDSAGKGDGSGDPQVDALMKKAQSEFDTEKRKAIINDAQRYLAGKMYNLPKPGGANTFTMAWPALANFNTYNGDRRTQNYYWWIDDTQAPVKKA